MAYEHARDSAQAITDYIVRERSDLRIKSIDPSTSLLDTGVLDSVFLVQLVAFLEERFGVRIDQSDVTPGNFESVETIDRLVRGKLAPRSA
jgi:acyl carrier protein